MNPKRKDIAAALGVKPSQVSRYAKRGMPTHDFDAAKVWKDRNINPYSKPSTSASEGATAAGRPHLPNDIDLVPYEKSRARREKIEADMAELRLAELSGQLVRADEVERGQQREHAMIRESFMQMPERVVPLLAADPTPAKMLAVLRAEIRGVLEQLSQADPE